MFFYLWVTNVALSLTRVVEDDKISPLQAIRAHRACVGHSRRCEWGLLICHYDCRVGCVPIAQQDGPVHMAVSLWLIAIVPNNVSELSVELCSRYLSTIFVDAICESLVLKNLFHEHNTTN